MKWLIQNVKSWLISVVFRDKLFVQSNRLRWLELSLLRPKSHFLLLVTRVNIVIFELIVERDVKGLVLAVYLSLDLLWLIGWCIGLVAEMMSRLFGVFVGETGERLVDLDHFWRNEIVWLLVMRDVVIWCISGLSNLAHISICVYIQNWLTFRTFDTVKIGMLEDLLCTQSLKRWIDQNFTD